MSVKTLHNHFSESDIAWLKDICQQATGNTYRQDQIGLVLNRIHSEMFRYKKTSIDDYISLIENDDEAWSSFVGAVTIHTTSWFREFPHYKMLQEHLDKNWRDKAETFEVLSAACSTGEEVYSLALLLENFKSKNPKFKYNVYGFDIDPISVQTAKDAIYEDKYICGDLAQYKKYLLLGEDEHKGYFTLSDEILERCHFKSQSLMEPFTSLGKYDFIFCRNVLIYFKPTDVELIVIKLRDLLKPSAMLCLGHSEHVDFRKINLELISNSAYKIKSHSESKSNIMSQAGAVGNSTLVGVNNLQAKASSTVAPIQNESHTVLIVDDSKVVRHKLKLILAKVGFKVTEAVDAIEAENLTKQNNFSLITLDMFMPGQSGAAWLKSARQSHLKAKVIMVSDANPSDAPEILEVLENNMAQTFFEKQKLNGGEADFVNIIECLLGIESGTSHLQPILGAAANSGGVSLKASDLTGNVNTAQRDGRFSGAQRASDASISGNKRSSLNARISNPEVILMGASTGGTNALAAVLKDMPANMPPVIVVQHITVNFSKQFAERLAEVSLLKLGNIQEGEPLKAGHIYIALGDYHIGVEKKAGVYRLTTSSAAPIMSHRPSVDHLFFKAAEADITKSMAILLTGMGSDGAKGMKALHDIGNYTLAQNKESSVVYGMPKVAHELGAVDFSGNLAQIRDEILLAVSGSQIRSAQYKSGA